MGSNSPLFDEIISSSSESEDQSILSYGLLKNLEIFSSPTIPVNKENFSFSKAISEKETTLNILEFPNITTVNNLDGNKDPVTEEKVSKLPVKHIQRLYDSQCIYSTREKNQNLMVDEMMNKELIKKIVGSQKNNNVQVSLGRMVNEENCKEISDYFVNTNFNAPSVENFNLDRMYQNSKGDSSTETNSEQTIDQYVDNQMNIELHNIQLTFSSEQNRKKISSTNIQEEHHSNGMTLSSSILQKEHSKAISNLELSHENDNIISNYTSNLCFLSKNYEFKNDELCDTSQTLFSTEITQLPNCYGNEKNEPVFDETAPLIKKFHGKKDFENIDHTSVDTRDLRIQNFEAEENSDSGNSKSIDLESSKMIFGMEHNLSYHALSQDYERNSFALPELQLAEVNNAEKSPKLEEQNFQENTFDANEDLKSNSPSLLESIEDNSKLKMCLNTAVASFQSSSIQSTSNNEKSVHTCSKLTVHCNERELYAQNNEKRYGLKEKNEHPQELCHSSSETIDKLDSDEEDTNTNISSEHIQSFDCKKDKGMKNMKKSTVCKIVNQSDNKIDSIETKNMDKLSFENTKQCENLSDEDELKGLGNSYTKYAKSKMFFKSGISRCKKSFIVPWKVKELNDKVNGSDIRTRNGTDYILPSTEHNELKNNPTVFENIKQADKGVEKIVFSNQLEPTRKKESKNFKSNEKYTDNVTVADTAVLTIVEKQNEIKSFITKRGFQSKAEENLVYKDTKGTHLMQSSKRNFDETVAGIITTCDNEGKKSKLDISLPPTLRKENIIENNCNDYLSVNLNVSSQIRINDITYENKDEYIDKIYENSEGNCKEIMPLKYSCCQILQSHDNLLKTSVNSDMTYRNCQQDSNYLAGKTNADDIFFSSINAKISPISDNTLTNSLNSVLKQNNKTENGSLAVHFKIPPTPKHKLTPLKKLEEAGKKIKDSENNSKEILLSKDKYSSTVEIQGNLLKSLNISETMQHGCKENNSNLTEKFAECKSKNQKVSSSESEKILQIREDILKDSLTKLPAEQENITQIKNSLPLHLNSSSLFKQINSIYLSKLKNAEKIHEDSKYNNKETPLSKYNCPPIQQENLEEVAKISKTAQHEHGIEHSYFQEKCSEKNIDGDGCFPNSKEISQTEEDTLTRTSEYTIENNNKFSCNDAKSKSFIENTPSRVDTEVKRNEILTEQEIIADSINAIQSTQKDSRLSYFSFSNIQTNGFSQLQETETQLPDKSKDNLPFTKTPNRRNKRKNRNEISTDCKNYQYINKRCTRSRCKGGTKCQICFEQRQEISILTSDVEMLTTDKKKNSILSSKAECSMYHKPTKINSRRRKTKTKNSADKFCSSSSFRHKMELLLEVTENKIKKSEKLFTTQKSKRNISYNIVHEYLTLKQLKPILANVELRFQTPGNEMLSNKIQQLKCYYEDVYLQIKELIFNGSTDFNLKDKSPLKNSSKVENVPRKKSTNNSKQENENDDVIKVNEFIVHHRNTLQNIKTSTKTLQQGRKNYRIPRRKFNGKKMCESIFYKNFCEKESLSKIALKFKDTVNKRKNASLKDDGITKENTSGRQNIQNLRDRLASNELLKYMDENSLSAISVSSATNTQKTDSIRSECTNSDNNWEVSQACIPEASNVHFKDKINLRTLNNDKDLKSHNLSQDVAQRDTVSDVFPLPTKSAITVTNIRNSNSVQKENATSGCNEVNSNLAYTKQNLTHFDSISPESSKVKELHSENIEPLCLENIEMLNSSKQCSSYVDQNCVEDSHSESLLAPFKFRAKNYSKSNTMKTYWKKTVSGEKIQKGNSIQPEITGTEINKISSFEANTIKKNSLHNLHLINSQNRDKCKEDTYGKRTTDYELVLKIKEPTVIPNDFESVNKNKMKKVLSKMDISSLVRKGLLKPGYNVLTIHTPEKLHFASVHENGNIVSEPGESYDSLIKWCTSIPNIFKGEKTTKMKCFKRVYYQGRNLLHYMRAYQRLTDSQCSQENQDFSDSVVGSTAPMGGSLFPVVLNLSKMKLLLIGNNEIGNTSIEIEQWNDIDKWDM